MQIVNLYRYEENGTVIITPNQRSKTDQPSRYRLIADEGAMLTDGGTETEVIDIMLEDFKKWQEVSTATETDYINALEELGVSFDD